MTLSFAQQWLNDARWAASGGNAQPWVVQIDETDDYVAFLITIDPIYRRQPSALDINGMASAMALGTLTFNLMVVAGNSGFCFIKKNYITLESIWSGAVELVFGRGPTESMHLKVSDVLNRRTDRGPYNRIGISLELERALEKILNRNTIGTFREFRTDKGLLQPYLSDLEKIRWQNPTFLNSLIEEISFESDPNRSPDKIPAMQLGINFAERTLLRIIQKFPALGCSFRLGLHVLPAYKGTMNFLNYCDRVYLLQAKDNCFESCVRFGEYFQELWLEVNRHSTSFQPLGAPLIALAYWENPEAYGFSKSQKRSIEFLTECFRTQFEIDLKKLTIGFRIGLPIRQAAKSPRKDLLGRYNSELLKTILAQQ